MKTTDRQRLVGAARAAKDRAYAPYSGFPVGAAVLTDDGSVFSGCNVENASYGLSCCAERNAVAAAVRAGQRRVTAVAVIGDSATPLAPCGACRQVLHEFNPRMTVLMTARNGRTRAVRLDRLLPYSFGPGSLKTGNKKSKR
jgi:cytidine deaminase